MLDFIVVVGIFLVFFLAIYGGQKFYESMRKQQKRPHDDADTSDEWQEEIDNSASYAYEPTTQEDLDEFWGTFTDDDDSVFLNDIVPEPPLKSRKRTTKKTSTKKTVAKKPTTKKPAKKTRTKKEQ